MTHVPDPAIWRPVEALASEWGAPVSEIVSLILDGAVEGKRSGNRWYVLRPVVTLHYPNPADRRHAELRLRTCRLGNFLTAGRGELVIPIHRGDPGLAGAIAPAWKLARSKPQRAATVRLGAQEWIIDSTLVLDLGRCLLSFQEDHKVGEYPEGDDTCG